MNQNQEPTRKALRGVEVDEWLNHCAPEGAFLQQAPRRTCAELGVCQQRTPACSGCDCQPFNALVMPTAPVEPVATAKPRTVWAFAISFGSWDLVGAVCIVALAYFAAWYNG